MRLLSLLAVAAFAVPVSSASACPPGDPLEAPIKCPPDAPTTLTALSPTGGSKTSEVGKTLLRLAVPTIRAGQRISGSLTTSDMAMEDGSYADLYRVVGAAGQRYTLTLRSTDFDAFLSVGTTTDEADPEAFDTFDADDDNGGGESGTDALVTFTFPDDGTVYVRANSLNEGETGAYTLEMADAAALQAPTVAPIRAGQTVNGRLDDGDGQLLDDSYVDIYTFTARAGQTYEITMTSDDFDAYLSVGSGEGDAYEEIDSNDDGAGEDDGTNARLTFTAATSGVHSIRANSLGNGEIGAYTLRLVQR